MRRLPALNRQAGSVGPEFNVPRNITELRDEASLAAFFRNSRPFRASSAMPVVEGKLTDAEIAEILAYLRCMHHEVPLTPSD